MKYEVVESKTLDEGIHEGTIVGLTERVWEKGAEKVTYKDVLIKTQDGTEVKYGCPLKKVDGVDKITTGSRIGKLLTALKIDLSSGGVDLESMVGKRVKFLVQQEAKDNGTFANIVDGSVKLVETPSPVGGGGTGALHRANPQITKPDLKRFV